MNAMRKTPPMISPPAARTNRSDGFTLAELVLALSITTLMGACITSMLYSFSYGSTVQSDNREAMVASELVKMRMSEAVQRSTKVLAQGTNYLVLWTADDGDGIPQLSELRRIEYDATAMTLTSYQPPLNPAPNTAYNLTTTNFDTVTSALKGTTQMPGQLWGNISSFATILDNATVQSAKFVARAVTVKSDHGGTEMVVGGAALRNS